MEYHFHKLPLELHRSLDGRTYAMLDVTGYVEVVPDTTNFIGLAPASAWSLGHVMLDMGSHFEFADAWIEPRVRTALLSSGKHVDAIRLMWGQSQRDMRTVFDREAAYA